MADLVMLGIVAVFVRGGWSSGFIKRLAGFLFLIVSFVAGSYLREPLGGVVNAFLPKIPEEYAGIVGYTVAFSALDLGLNFATSKLLSKVAPAGLRRALDKVLGLVFGALEGLLLLSALIVIIHTYADSSVLGGLADVGVLHDIRTAIDGSTIGKLLEHTTVPVVLLVLGPLLPTDIKSIVPTTIPGGLPGFPIPSIPQ